MARPVSQTAEYAMRAVVWLAAHDDGLHAVEAIAEGTHVSRSYLSKVLNMLCRAGIVEAQRGPGGGCRLLHRPRDITLLSVLNAVDPIGRIDDCEPQRCDALSTLYRYLDRSTAQVERALRKCTLEQLVVAAESAHGTAPDSVESPRDNW